MQPLFTFIGGGNMGRALIGGLLAHGHTPAQIRVADSIAAARNACESEFGVAVFDDNSQAIAGADAIVLAVKPQQMREVASALDTTLASGAIYLSIAAGLTTTHLQSWLGEDRAIVRAMPNTPALVGRGAAAMYATSAVTPAQRELAYRLMSAVGYAAWVEQEAALDAVTAISGSGPAYFFLFIELIEKVAIELGLESELARRLALETALGASSLACDSDSPPATLRQQVTSPGGTTERALASFSAAKLEEIVRAALTAARDRSVELAAEVKA